MRLEFPAKVKLAAYKRSLKDGHCHCEECGVRVRGLPEYDHIKPDGLGGEPTLDNCQVLCGPCHREKTHQHDRPIMQKADNQRKAAAGIKRTGRKLKGRNTFQSYRSNTKVLEEL